MGLAQETCIPCRGGEGKLEAAEVEALLGTLSGWSIDGINLIKRLSFKNFVQALEFVNRAGEVAEAQNHHPDFTLGWGYVGLVLTTHDAGGLTRNDFIVAAKLDALVA